MLYGGGCKRVKCDANLKGIGYKGSFEEAKSNSDDSSLELARCLNEKCLWFRFVVTEHAGSEFC